MEQIRQRYRLQGTRANTTATTVSLLFSSVRRRGGTRAHHDYEPLAEEGVGLPAVPPLRRKRLFFTREFFALGVPVGVPNTAEAAIAASVSSFWHWKVSN